MLSSATHAQKSKKQIAQAKRLYDQGSKLYEVGRYAEAIPLAEQVLSILEKIHGREHSEVATALNNLAELYRETGDYERAESLFKSALAIQKRASGPEHPEVVTLLNNLAMLYQGMGNYAQAKPLYNQALSITEKRLGPRHLGLTTPLNNLAELYREMGDFTNAEPLHWRALRLTERALGPMHVEVATSLNNLGALYEDQGDYARAEPLYKRAISILEKKLGADHFEVATSLDNLGVLYFDKEDYGQAEALYKRALAIREKTLGPKHPDVALSLNNLALLYDVVGDYARAKSLYERALQIYEESFPPQHPLVATSLDNLAGLYYAEGDFGRAVQFLARGLEIQEHNLALILTSGSENQKQLYINTLSGETDGAVSLHVLALPNDESAANLAVTAILRRKGRALDAMTNQLGHLRRRADSQVQKLLDEWKRTCSHLATLQISSGGHLMSEDIRAEVARLTIKVDRLEDELSSRSAEFRAENFPITLEAVRQAIPSDGALVEIFAYQPFNAKATSVVEKWASPHYVAYIVMRDEVVPKWVDLGEVSQIDEAVARWKQMLDISYLRQPGEQISEATPRERVVAHEAKIKELARAVDERVMRPIRRLLGHTRRLFLSPDGALNLIPFAALVDENNQYLVENYSISYLMTGRDLLRLHLQTENPSAPMVIANPLYDLYQSTNQSLSQSNKQRRSLDFTFQAYEPLPGTGEEATALSKLWPDLQVLTQDQATEDALKRVTNPLFLHIATHGFFLPDKLQKRSVSTMRTREISDSSLSETSLLPVDWENPMLRSGLVLAGVRQLRSGADEDGVLTALEVAGLDLSGTKLVVLSACETGLGNAKRGVGVYGLRRALVLAGSETQVMSLWKVSDVGTRDLMTAYYKRLRAGEGRTEALRQVQLAMLRGELKSTLDSVDYRQPYYWAAFICSGDWRSLDGKEPKVGDTQSSSKLTLTFLASCSLIILLLFLTRFIKGRPSLRPGN